jgi:hypothetical protein
MARHPNKQNSSGEVMSDELEDKLRDIIDARVSDIRAKLEEQAAKLMEAAERYDRATAAMEARGQYVPVEPEPLSASEQLARLMAVHHVDAPSDAKLNPRDAARYVAQQRRKR